MRRASERARVFAPIPALPVSRDWVAWPLGHRDTLALAVCALYSLALLAFDRAFRDISPRVYDFLHHAALARDIAAGQLAVNGFYPLGYPTLLAAGVALGPNVFVVGKLISGLAAAGVLFVSQRLVGALLADHALVALPLLAMVAIGLSPTFLQHATTPGTDMPHVALLLASCWLVVEAVGSPRSRGLMLAAGIAGGLSYLVRYTSLLILPALGLWLLLGSPWGRATLRHGGEYLVGFLVAAAPQLVLSTLQHGSPFYTTALGKNAWVGIYAGPLPELTWGEVADSVSLLTVIRADPGRFLLNWGGNIAGPPLGNDLAAAIAWSGQVLNGAPFAIAGSNGLAALLPGLLKLVAGLGALILLLRGTTWVPDLGVKAGFLSLFAALFAAATALAFITERLLLLLVPLLVALSFAALGHVASAHRAMIVGIGAIALLSVHLATFGYPARWMLGYEHAHQASDIIRAQGAVASEVYTTNWGFYDYDSRWLAHYEHFPIGIASVEDLTALMRARGIRYLVYDRNGGIAQWPQLAALAHPEWEPGGLRLVGDPIQSRETPPNLVLVYALP